MAAFIYPQDGTGRVIGFDAVETENYETVSEITEHPVETGVSVSDHVRPLPDRISLVGFVSNQPIYIDPIKQRGIITSNELPIPEYFPSPEALLTSPGGALRFGAGALGNAIGDLLGLNEAKKASVLTFAEAFNAPSEKYVELLELQKNAVLLTVVSPLLFFDSMVIERVSAPRTAGNAGVSFQIDMRKLRVVESGQVTAAPVPVEPRGLPESAKGAQGAKPPDAGEDAVKPKSLAAQIADAFGAGI